MDSSKLNAKKLYDMELHDQIEVQCGPINYNIVRVPGGWIYNHVRLDKSSMTTTFIEYDNEFQIRTPKTIPHVPKEKLRKWF